MAHARVFEDGVTDIPKQLFPFLIAVLLGTTGCATTDIPNVAQEGYQLEDDERRMMKRADEFVEIIDESGHVYHDPQLEKYLNDLANRFISANVKATGLTVSVKVIHDPQLNAMALPNGRIYIHTGMLAAMDNEAQLATVLAHEITHVVHRHILKQFRSTINKSAFMWAVAVPAAFAGGGAGALLVETAVVSSVYGFSQEMEFEADEGGFAALRAQGYDVRESKKIYEHLKGFIEDEDIEQPFFFSTHPKVMARIKKYSALIDATPKEELSGAVGTEEFLNLTHEVILKNAERAVERGMFKSAQRNIEKYIALNPDAAVGYFFKGELYRQRQDHGKREKRREKAADYETAVAAYTRAIELDDRYAEAVRGRGQVLGKQGAVEAARKDFQKYLELRPEAEDRLYIEEWLKK